MQHFLSELIMTASLWAAVCYLWRTHRESLSPIFYGILMICFGSTLGIVYTLIIPDLLPGSFRATLFLFLQYIFFYIPGLFIVVKCAVYWKTQSHKAPTDQIQPLSLEESPSDDLLAKELNVIRKNYQAIFDNTIDGIMIFEPESGPEPEPEPGSKPGYRPGYRPGTDGINFVLKDLNRASEKLENKSRDTLIGKNIKEIIPAIHDENLFEIIKRVYITGISEYLPMSHDFEKETQVWREFFIYRFNSGELVITYHDISEQKKLEYGLYQAMDALRESENQFRTVFQTSPDSIHINTLEDGCYINVNEGFTRLTGYTKNEVIGKTNSDLNIWRFPKQRDMLIESLKTNQFVLNHEVQLQDKNFRSFTALISARIIKLYHKPHILAVIHDIEEWKQAQIALSESEERYRTILESIAQGYYEIDNDGRFIFFNDFMCELIGCSKKELLNKKYSDFMDTDNSEKVRRVFNKIYATGKPNLGFTWELARSDGEKRQIGASASLMISPINETIGFRGIARDISERKLLEAQLSQAQKLESIGQLAAGIAHEINTPIQFIGDNIHFLDDAFQDIFELLDKYEDFVDQAKNSTEIVAAIENISALSENMDLEYLIEEIPKAIQQSLEGISRTANIVLAMKEFSHPGVKDKTDIDINKAITNTLTVSRNEWKYIADIETNLDLNLPQVPCLPGEFNQVILNIIINATHAIADVIDTQDNGKGKITISTTQIDQVIEIKISDTGAGIPDDIQKRIFDPFFTTKGVGKGTGQGLAIAHAVIVNKHGGNIRFETAKGKGTSFIIQLPLDDNYNL